MSLVEKYFEKAGSDFAKEIIKEYMKKNKMDTIEEFRKVNPNLAAFQQNTKLENSVPIIVSRWKSFREAEFQELLEELQKEEDEKKKLNTDSISTTVVNGHEISTVTNQETGKQVMFDNSTTNRDIDMQMNDIQNEHAQFQTLDGTKNTDGVLDYMENNVKITPDTVESTDIDTKKAANEDEEQIMNAVKGLENELGYPVEVDLNSKIIYDRVDNIIYSIEKRDGVYQIITQDTKQESNDEKKKESGPSLSLKINRDIDKAA